MSYYIFTYLLRFVSDDLFQDEILHICYMMSDDSFKDEILHICYILSNDSFKDEILHIFYMMSDDWFKDEILHICFNLWVIICLKMRSYIFVQRDLLLGCRQSVKFSTESYKDLALDEINLKLN